MGALVCGKAVQVPRKPGLRPRLLIFLPAPHLRSLPLIAVQPPFSTIHCKCLYSLANFVLHYFMLSSPNPQISSSTHSTALSCTSSICFTSSTSFTSSHFAQSLPTFSTPNKYGPHTNSRNSISFMRLLHTSLYTPGFFSTFNPITFYDPCPSPAQARLPPPTPRRSPNSFRRNTYKKKRGGGSLLFATPQHPPRLRVLLSLLLSHPSAAAPPAPKTPQPSLITSLLHYVFTSPPLSSYETLSSPLASHHLQAVPCGGSIKNQTSQSPYGGEECASMRVWL